MATRVRSVHTEEVLNVSQNAESSPPDFRDARSHSRLDDNDEIIENSLPNATKAYRGGAVQASQPPRADEDDDLYAVSPRAKKAANRGGKAASRNGASAKATERAPRSTQSVKKEVTPYDAAAMARDAMKQLAERGAVVHVEIGGSQLQQLTQSSACKCATVRVLDFADVIQTRCEIFIHVVRVPSFPTPKYRMTPGLRDSQPRDLQPARRTVCLLPASPAIRIRRLQL